VTKIDQRRFTGHKWLHVWRQCVFDQIEERGKTLILTCH
jgi:hypothetical protein